MQNMIEVPSVDESLKMIVDGGVVMPKRAIPGIGITRTAGILRGTSLVLWSLTRKAVEVF